MGILNSHWVKVLASGAGDEVDCVSHLPENGN